MASLNIYGQSIWLVVWNILIFPYIGNNHPNWREYVSEGLKPPTRYLRLDKLYSPVGKLLDTPIVFCCQWSSWWDGGLLRGTIVNLCTMVKLLIVQKKGRKPVRFHHPNISKHISGSSTQCPCPSSNSGTMASEYIQEESRGCKAPPAAQQPNPSGITSYITAFLSACRA